MLHLHEGPDGEEKKKAQHWAGFKPTTSRVWLGRRVPYCCSTTAALDDKLVSCLKTSNLIFLN